MVTSSRLSLSVDIRLGTHGHGLLLRQGETATTSTVRIGQVEGACSPVARPQGLWATYATPGLAILERVRAPPNLRNSWIQDCLGTSLSVNRKWNHNSSRQQRQRALECKSMVGHLRPNRRLVRLAITIFVCPRSVKYPPCETVARGS